MKIKLGIIFGGKAPEHEISIISASQVLKAINLDKYDIIPIYISKNQLFYTGDILLNLTNYKDLDNLLKQATQIDFSQKDNNLYIKKSNAKLLNNYISKIDLVIPVMHGINGEDGTIHGLLQSLNVPYAGCDITSAAVGQDKVIQKCIMQAHNIPTCPWFYMYANNFDNDLNTYLQQAKNLGYPLIIKPSNLGSSIGIEIANNENEFIDKIRTCSKYDNKLLIEKCLKDFTEINISVLGNTYKQKLSITEQVLKHDEILSFNDKYLGNSSKKLCSTKTKGMASTSRIIPADIDDKLIKEIERHALNAFLAIGASGVCRIDFMLDNTTNNIYLVEINTIPGSLAFYLWEKVGIPFDALIDELVSIAIDNQRIKDNLVITFDSNILKTL